MNMYPQGFPKHRMLLDFAGGTIKRMAHFAKVANMISLNTSRRWLGILFLCIAPAFAHAAPPLLAIGVYLPAIRDVPRKDVEITVRVWVEEIASKVGVSIRPVQLYDDLSALKRDVVAGKVNYIVSTPMGLAQHFSDDDLADGFASAGAANDALLLVVRRDAGIRRPADLAGRHVQLRERDELSEIYLNTLLRVSGVSPSQLKTVSTQRNANALVLKLFFNQCDAALITRNAFEIAGELNPQIRKRLQVLDAYTFEAYRDNIGMFSSSVSTEDREAITAAALTMDNTPRGRQLLEIYRTDKLIRSHVSDLHPYRALLATHNKLATNGR
ncbi:MAG: phosphate/phosphite/phosphonate ABC transporter substrate-binding protein [Azoarcus sp.]|nr:phosphate/phosphite/phosphonate ABC transporter substrate-binding protein [Azoarcus sp.]